MLVTIFLDRTGHLFITVLADGLAPDGAWPSADTALTAELSIIFQFCMLMMFLLITQHYSKWLLRTYSIFAALEELVRICVCRGWLWRMRWVMFSNKELPSRCRHATCIEPCTDCPMACPQTSQVLSIGNLQNIDRFLTPNLVTYLINNHISPFYHSLIHIIYVLCH